MPILVLSFQGGIEHRARAYEMGVDDFIQKPLELRECLLRAQALLRRYNSAAPAPARPAVQYHYPVLHHAEHLGIWENAQTRFFRPAFKKPVQADMVICEYFKAQGVKIKCSCCG